MGLAGQSLQQCAFLRRVGQGDVDDEDRHQVGLAGIEAALEDVDAGQGRRWEGQDAAGGGAQGDVGGRGRFSLGQGELDFGDADHGSCGRVVIAPKHMRGWRG
jgi:hypothetical protein